MKWIFKFSTSVVCESQKNALLNINSQLVMQHLPWFVKTELNKKITNYELIIDNLEMPLKHGVSKTYRVICRIGISKLLYQSDIGYETVLIIYRFTNFIISPDFKFRTK